jgi:hypothetical protein
MSPQKQPLAFLKPGAGTLRRIWSGTSSSNLVTFPLEFSEYFRHVVPCAMARVPRKPRRDENLTRLMSASSGERRAPRMRGALRLPIH